MKFSNDNGIKMKSKSFSKFSLLEISHFSKYRKLVGYAGANYASSPNRVLIHCLDPVMVCEKIAYSNIKEIVGVKDIIDNTITGIKGIGGLETRGKYREGYPKSIYLK